MRRHTRWVTILLCIMLGVLLAVRVESGWLTFVSPVPAVWHLYFPLTMHSPVPFEALLYLPIVSKSRY